MNAQPLSRINALVSRMRTAFPECAVSLSLLGQWILEQLGLQRRWSCDARAIDDPLEAALVTFEAALPTLKGALANDPPARRREVMTAAHAILHAARETHRRTEALAAEITPPALGNG